MKERESRQVVTGATAGERSSSRSRLSVAVPCYGRAMERRSFLRMVGAASIAPGIASASPPNQTGATVLFDDRAMPLTAIRRKPNDPSSLWIRKRDLPRVNGFDVKPQGACHADICIPIPKTMLDGEWLALTAFAKKAGQAVVSDVDARVWSFGEIQALRGSFLNSREAPDITIPDRRGRPVKLSDFRGKKMLLVTWASW